MLPWWVLGSVSFRKAICSVQRSNEQHHWHQTPAVWNSFSLPARQEPLPRSQAIQHPPREPSTTALRSSMDSKHSEQFLHWQVSEGVCRAQMKDEICCYYRLVKACLGHLQREIRTKVFKLLCTLYSGQASGVQEHCCHHSRV